MKAARLHRTRVSGDDTMKFYEEIVSARVRIQALDALSILFWLSSGIYTPPVRFRHAHTHTVTYIPLPVFIAIK